ncbi:hypothetical protein [Mucisphaera calidilacus]|uniref:Lipoprotein n=1 Tax=Mucisphaera calidilacus TaxID=2527982 RepID=A0A518BUJ8_9BACT|nr:hypothetical protein [Mucisphaera calidilacus]QDU70662.1 hypothetical protein Pan265_04920 [Mucisphaera calidilacus]
MMRTMRCVLSVLLVGVVVLGSGCKYSKNQLFPPHTPRSPYERYLALRDRERTATYKDAYGRDQPNLRERLRPLDTP